MEESTCEQPCDPDAGCEECAAYWDRMEYENLWDRREHRWTDKGLKEMLK